MILKDPACLPFELRCRVFETKKANQARFPVGSHPDFRMCKLCRLMSLVGGFSRGSLISPALAFWRCYSLTSLHRHRLSRPLQCFYGNTARLARRSDEALGVRVTVARIAPSLLDLGRGVPTEEPSPNISCTLHTLEARLPLGDFHATKHRYAKAGENGKSPRKSSGLIPTCGYPGAIPTGIRTRLFSMGGEYLATAPSWALSFDILRLSYYKFDTKCMGIVSDDGFLGDLPFSPPFIPALLYSHFFTTVGSQDLDVISRPNLFTHSLDTAKQLASNNMVRLLTSHLEKPVSIPGSAASRFSHAGIVPDDAAGRRVFSGISRFPSPFIPVALHTYLVSPSSALKDFDLNSRPISPLHFKL
ncbi:hypothetical protein PR048_022473 [Dryococelus australis]|uniref:Uncharacterized protein n=1 Tax=Dryococelus australis TaxID=614101 RepID=A0ABQ9H133_9NEOP|nr:hypothetical protein PR048_022473 [Dryococelus australis]